MIRIKKNYSKNNFKLSQIINKNNQKISIFKTPITSYIKDQSIC